MYGCPLLPALLSTFTHYIGLFSHAPYPLHDPYHLPAPACSPHSHFRFFGTIYGCPPATSTSLHPSEFYAIVFHTPPSHVWSFPPPCPCLTPYPHFCICFYLIAGTYMIFGIE
jgi:hypothetical protein